MSNILPFLSLSSFNLPPFSRSLSDFCARIGLLSILQFLANFNVQVECGYLLRCRNLLFVAHRYTVEIRVDNACKWYSLKLRNNNSVDGKLQRKIIPEGENSSSAFVCI